MTYCIPRRRPIRLPLAVLFLFHCGFSLLHAQSPESGSPAQTGGPSTHLEPAPTLNFRRVTGTSLDSIRRNSLAGAWGDYDGDGRQDLFIAADDGGQGELHRNLPGGFVRISTGSAVTSQFSRTAPAWGDWDNDGDPDLFVTSDSGGSARLYRTLRGGLFGSTTSHPTTAVGLSLSTLWLDYDSDGFLDLFVANGGGGRQEANFLYRNRGDGTFDFMSGAAITSDTEYSQGVTAADFDSDGDLDLLVINLFGPLALYRNDGAGQFARIVNGQVGAASTLPLGGTSAAWGDYNNDGDLDLVVITGQSRNLLYLNNSGDLVLDGTSIVSNLGSESAGAAWADLNNDGSLDLVIPSRSGGALVFVGDGTGILRRITGGALDSEGRGNGLAIADYDLDGDLDVWISNWGVGSTPMLFQNQSSGNHWMRIHLRGGVSNRDGIGAKIRVKATIRGNAVTQVRQIGGFDSAGSHELTAHFGLGDAATVESIRVEWPSGTVTHLGPLPSNESISVSEPDPRTQVQIVQQPVSLRVNAGETARFEVSATGTPPISYAWYLDDALIPGATQAELKIPSVSGANLGTYRAVVSDATGATESQTASLAFWQPPPAAPTILTHPATQTVLEGNSATLSVAAVSSVEMTFRWLFNDAAIPNATSSSLVLGPVTPSQAGRYRAVVSNTGGSVTSHEAVLVVIPGEAPSFVTQPADSTVRTGDAVVFAPEVRGTQPIQFTWYHDDTLIGGATGLQLVIPSVTTAHAGRYRVRASNAFGTATSSEARLSLLAPTSPVILTHLTNQIVPTGSTVTLGIAVTGSEPLSFVWRRDGELVPGGPYGSQLVLSGVRPEQSGLYTVRAVNPYGFADSSPALLRVTNPPPPVITVQPGDFDVPLGTDVTWETAAEGTPPLRYQWFYNGEILPNQTSPTLRLIAVQLVNEGRYTLQVSNAGGAVTSRVATITLKSTPRLEGGTVLFVNRISGLLDAPVLLDDGATRVAGPGYVAQLYGGATVDTMIPIGDPAPFRDGDGAGYWNAGSAADRGIASVTPGAIAWVEVRAWALAAGTTFEEADRVGGLRGRSGVFQLRTGGDGAPPTVPAWLTSLSSFALVSGLATAIETQPAGLEVDLGQPFSLSVTAVGTGLTYQWLRDATTISGATGSTFNVAVSDLIHSGDYQVVVRGLLGSVTSSVARVSVRVRHDFALGPEVEVISGARFSVPITVVTAGNLSGGTLGIRFNPQHFTAPAVTWSPALSNAVIRVLTPTEGDLRILFNQPGQAIPAGTQALAQISFRARTTSTNRESSLQLAAQNLTDPAGKTVSTGIRVTGTTVHIAESRFVADLNGNNRLDVGDATLLRRLAQRLDTPQPWEITRRDLTGDGALDEADVQTLLRILTLLDPSPAGSLAPVGPTMTPRFELLLAQEDGARGPLLVARVMLRDLDQPVSGAQFTLAYPTAAVRLVSASALLVGPMVPPGAGPVWNAEPGHLFTEESGRIHFAAAASMRWTSATGVLAELTFAVQPGSSRRPTWSIDLTASELSVDGHRLEPGGTFSEFFSGRAPVAPRVTTVAITGDGEWSMVIHGEPRAHYHIEVSADLRTWTWLDTVATDDAGATSFRDVTSTGLAFRFYRLVDARE